MTLRGSPSRISLLVFPGRRVVRHPVRFQDWTTRRASRCVGGNACKQVSCVEHVRMYHLWVSQRKIVVAPMTEPASRRHATSRDAVICKQNRKKNTALGLDKNSQKATRIAGKHAPIHFNSSHQGSRKYQQDFFRNFTFHELFADRPIFFLPSHHP